MRYLLVAENPTPVDPRLGGSMAERGRRLPPWFVRTALDLTVRMLPAAHRGRYALELYADVLSMPRRDQVREVLSLLIHVQQLAWALGDASPEVEG